MINPQIVLYTDLPVPISFQDLIKRVKTHIADKGQTPEQFEDTTGWYLSDCLADPEKIWEKPVMFLQDICRPLDINWLATIPG